MHLIKSDITYYIKESSDRSQFDPNNNTILWNPYRLLQHESTGLWTSSVTVLAHEVAHAARYDKAKKGGKLKEFGEGTKKGSDSQYNTREEKEVIINDEQEAARKHGEISGNQVTRTAHDGTVVPGDWSQVSVKKQVEAVRQHNVIFLDE